MAVKNKFMVFVLMCCAGIMTISFITSCGKGGNVTPNNAKIQFQVVNLSPDLQPVYLYVGTIRQSNTYYTYPSPSGYFSLANLNPPIQIRSTNALVSTTNIISIDSINLHPYFKYTLFITGLRADTSVTSIFTVDTAGPPPAGRSKLRFVNASPHSAAFDITANDSMAFTNKKYKDVSGYILMPPGNYNFKILPTGQRTIVSTLPNTTLADGKVYTIYCRGVAGGADSVAFGAGIITNR